MKPTKRSVALYCALVLTTFGSLKGSEGEPKKRGEFLTPSEFAELGEKSKVQYATHIVKSGAELPSFRHPGYPKDGASPETTYPQISEGNDGHRSLLLFRPSAIADKALKQAEPLLQKKEYDLALPIYLEASQEDPKCYLLYLSIGDCYLFSGNPVAALDNYDKAIDLNPDDFHGHWFRASALVELGRMTDARHSYARALALSPGNPSLLKAINARADRLGFNATEEIFHPQATAQPEGDAYVIYTVDVTHWWIYGLCKAVWLAEPEHRKDLTGSSDHRWTNTEELECMANLLARYEIDRDEEEMPAEPELDRLMEVLHAKSLGAFVDYEFGSQVSRDYTLLIGRESQDKIVRFVEQYVFQQQVTQTAPSGDHLQGLKTSLPNRNAARPNSPDREAAQY